MVHQAVPATEPRTLSEMLTKKRVTNGWAAHVLLHDEHVQAPGKQDAHSKERVSGRVISGNLLFRALQAQPRLRGGPRLGQSACWTVPSKLSPYTTTAPSHREISFTAKETMIHAPCRIMEPLAMTWHWEHEYSTAHLFSVPSNCAQTRGIHQRPHCTQWVCRSAGCSLSKPVRSRVPSA